MGRKKVFDPSTTDDRSVMLKQAAEFMMAGEYQQSIQAYQEFARRFPEEAALSESQIGAAYFFLGDCNRALEYYLVAKNHGFDEDMADDNVWEVCEVLYNQDKDPIHIHNYMRHFPAGTHTREANSILGISTSGEGRANSPDIDGAVTLELGAVEEIPPDLSWLYDETIDTDKEVVVLIEDGKLLGLHFERQGGKILLIERDLTRDSG